MTLSRFLAWIGGSSLILNIAMGIYIYALSATGNLRPDWMPITGKLMMENMMIVTVLVVIGALISHFLDEVA